MSQVIEAMMCGCVMCQFESVEMFLSVVMRKGLIALPKKQSEKMRKAYCNVQIGLHMLSSKRISLHVCRDIVEIFSTRSSK